MTTAEFLEIPEFRALVSPIAVEQYHGFPEFNEDGRRTELIRGLILEKKRKTPLHSLLVHSLRDCMEPQLPMGYSLRQHGPLTLKDSEPEPDIAIVRGTQDYFWESHPATAALTIEISVNTLALDRAKAHLYAEAGVDEYWMILANERRVEVHRGPVGELYTERTLVEGNAVLECGSVPGVNVALAELFR
jgi:Uma2 family endonuclease